MKKLLKLITMSGLIFLAACQGLEVAPEKERNQFKNLPTSAATATTKDFLTPYKAIASAWQKAFSDYETSTTGAMRTLLDSLNSVEPKP